MKKRKKISFGLGLVTGLAGALFSGSEGRAAELRLEGQGREFEGRTVVVADGETKYRFNVFGNNEHLMGEGTRGAIFELRRSPSYDIASNGVAFPDSGDFFGSPRIVNYSNEEGSRGFRILRSSRELEVEKRGLLASYVLTFPKSTRPGPLDISLTGRSRLLSKRGRQQWPVTMKDAKVLVVRRSDFDYNVDGFVDEKDVKYLSGLLTGPGNKYERGDLERKKMDFDRDGDVDLRDWSYFLENEFSGREPVE
jgi:hypothetical protein